MHRNTLCGNKNQRNSADVSETVENNFEKQTTSNVFNLIEIKIMYDPSLVFRL